MTGAAFVIIGLTASIMFVLVAHEEGAWAAFMLFICALLLWVWCDLSVVRFTRENVGLALALAIGHLAFGAAYAIFRWTIFVRECLRLYKERISDKERGSFLGVHHGWKIGTVPPQVLDSKGRIICWICYWELSAIEWFFADALMVIANEIYDRVAGFLQRISDRTFAMIQSDAGDKS